MKVIVSHAQKQHVYQLVYALQKSGGLEKFFTGLYFKENILLRMLSKYSKRVSEFILRRRYHVLDDKDILITYVPEMIYLIFGKLKSDKSVHYRERAHDYIVSKIQKFYDYDVVIGYEGQSLQTFKEAKKRNKITILDLASIHAEKVFQINENYHGIVITDMQLLKKSMDIKLEEYKYTDFYIVLSNFAKQACIEVGIPEEKIFTTYLGVNTDFFTQKVYYDTEIFEVLFVAGIRHLKGIKDLIESFEKLRLKNAVLTFVGGDGNATHYLNEHLSETIRHIPQLSHSELLKIYHRASILVLPSYMDSWGQVVCEAMACGTPVVVSEHTGAKDLIISGENGFITGVGDIESLKEKITFFYENKSEIERMGKNARQSVEHLNWDNYHQSINDIVDEIMTVKHGQMHEL